MRKIWLLITVIVCFFKVSAQSPEDILKVKEPNPKYLEHLIKFKIDSARKQLGYKPMANDSMLYLAAKFHADYLNENSKTGHTQVSDSLKSPELRLAVFGAGDYMNVEMVHSIYVHRPQSIKPDPNSRESIKETFKTYGAVANYFVQQWALDKDTKDDFINPKFNVIGLAVSINPLNDCIKVVANFGRPFLKYRFVENKEMFPYSTYETEQIINSFESIKTPVVTNRPYKIDIGVKEKCVACDQALEGINLKLFASSRKVYLSADEITNEAFAKFISSSKNGFMLEVVEYEDYHNGNPAYFEKPTRRNKKYIYNGEVEAPVLGDIAKNGYNAYKGSFKIQLGLEPKLNTLYEYNVYVIYKGKICNLIRFTEPIGDALALYEPLKLKPNFLSSDTNKITIIENEVSSSLKLEHSKNGFELAPQKIKAEMERHKQSDPNKTLTKALITLNIPLVENPKDTIDVLALQITKLKSEFETNFPNVAYEIVKIPNVAVFTEFYKNSKQVERKTFSDKQFVDLLQDSKDYELHKQLLDKSWSGSIKLTSFEDKLSIVQRKYANLKAKLDTLSEVSDDELISALKIQRETFLFLESKKAQLPKEVCIPMNKLVKLKPFYDNQEIYNYNTITEYTSDTLKYFYKAILENKEKKDASSNEKLNFLKFSINHMTNQPFDFNFRSNHLTAFYDELKPQMKENEASQIKKSMDVKLTFYYSYYSKAASLFESSLDELYGKYKNGSEDEVYKLALTFAYYNRISKVNEILQPYIGQNSKNTEMIVLYNKINQKYVDVFGNVPQEYMDILTQSFNNLGKKNWCGQFVGKGNISYQIFDYYPLYQKYCEECKSYVNAAQLMPY